jgi:hypothetical protein
VTDLAPRVRLRSPSVGRKRRDMPGLGRGASCHGPRDARGRGRCARGDGYQPRPRPVPPGDDADRPAPHRPRCPDHGRTVSRRLDRTTRRPHGGPRQPEMPPWRTAGIDRRFRKAESPQGEWWRDVMGGVVCCTRRTCRCGPPPRWLTGATWSCPGQLPNVRCGAEQDALTRFFAREQGCRSAGGRVANLLRSARRGRCRCGQRSVPPGGRAMRVGRPVTGGDGGSAEPSTA